MIEKSNQLLENLLEISQRHTKDPLKEEAWKRFIASGLPIKEDEAFRYVTFNELHQKSFYKNSLEESFFNNFQEIKEESYRFVFLNGVFVSSLSTLDGLPSEIVFCTIKEALQSYSSLLKGRFSKFLKEENSALSFLNYALFEEGFFLYIPPKVMLKKKIEILELYSSNEAQIYFPKFSIYVGKHVKATFKTKVNVIDKELSHFIDRYVEFHLDENASCSIENDALNIGSCWYFDHVSAYLKRDSHFSYVSGDRGGKLLRQEFKVHLLEENAEAFLKGLSILQHKDQSHHHVNMKHLAPGCRSHQHFKGLMFDQSKVSFEGKIWVDKIAQQTQAYQLCNHLLLGERASAYSKPNLEIFADDVKASHGATIAQLSKEEIFYLQARGLTPAFAKKLLVKGFCKELMNEMQSSLKEEMLLCLGKALEKEKE